MTLHNCRCENNYTRENFIYNINTHYANIKVEQVTTIISYGVPYIGIYIKGNY